MKKVLTTLFVVFLGLWGNVGVYAEPASNSLSLPNKFGVTGLYTLVGTDTLGDKTLSIGLMNDFSEFGLPDDPRTPRLMEVGLHIGFSVSDGLEIGGLIPYRLLDVSDESDIEGFDESGIGDILTTIKYRLLDEQNVLPAIGMFTMISFPTGDEEKGIGSGTVDVTVGGILTKQLGPMNLYGNLGFLLSGWKEGDPNPLFDNYQNSLLYGFGIELPMTSSKIRLFSEFTFVHEFGDDEDNQIITFTPRSTPLEDVVNDTGQASIGVNINLIGNVLLSGGAAFQILGEEAVPDGPDWRGFVNLSYVFGRRKATPSTDIKIFTDSAEEIGISPPIKETPITTPAEETPNRCPEITDVSLSDSVVNGGEQVRVTITAHDPDGDQLLYFWIASRGVLTGSETQITWTVSECSEFDATTGTHDLSIEVSDGECTVNRPIKILVNCTPPKRRPEVILPESTILFPQGSTKLDNIAKAQLDNIAALLRQFPDQTIRLEGHTDATGKEDANTRIGLKRAESVKQYLVTRHAIDPNRITTISYGSTRPAAPNDTKAGRAKNRRVEIYQRF